MFMSPLWVGTSVCWGRRGKIWLGLKASCGNVGLFLKLLCVASVKCWELLANITVDTPHTRINSKQIQCLHIESKTIKLLQENMGWGRSFKTLDFSDMTPKVQAKKENRYIGRSLKCKTVYQRTQSTEWKDNLWNGRKYFANRIWQGINTQDF